MRFTAALSPVYERTNRFVPWVQRAPRATSRSGFNTRCMPVSGYDSQTYERLDCWNFWAPRASISFDLYTGRRA